MNTPETQSGSSLQRMVSHRWTVLCGLLLLRGTGDSPYIAAVMAEERLGKSLDECINSAKQFLNRHASEYPNGKWQTAEKKWEMANAELTDAGPVTPASRETQSRHSVQ